MSDYNEQESVERILKEIERLKLLFLSYVDKSSKIGKEFESKISLVSTQNEQLEKSNLKNEEILKSAIKKINSQDIINNKLEEDMNSLINKLEHDLTKFKFEIIQENEKIKKEIASLEFEFKKADLSNLPIIKSEGIAELKNLIQTEITNFKKKNQDLNNSQDKELVKNANKTAIWGLSLGIIGIIISIISIALPNLAYIIEFIKKF